MKEIKFRGWNEGSKKFEYGNYEYDKRLQEHKILYYMPGVCIEQIVLPDTVGQYIGIQDINGKDVYEGDIVEFITAAEEIDVIVFKAPRFTGKKFDIEGYELEVIGNIYENSDLLKNESEV